jgi:uncharacterized protein YyaL (SSP411 family)
MSTSLFIRPGFLGLAALGACLLGSTSCRKDRSEETVTRMPGVVAHELLSNAIGSMPGAVYKSQTTSPICWQPWAKDSLNRAKAADRLIFGVIAIPQNPAFLKVLKALDSHTETVNTINASYVPSLIDGDACREMSILTGDLCAEIKRPLNMPLFIWFTYEGNPVAWIPVSNTTQKNVIDLFNQSHTMVSQMWRDNPSYVLKNSRLDNENRRTRMEQRKMAKVMSQEPTEDTIRSLRQLSSLYDPIARTFDEVGGLFPASSLELLASASIHPGVPADVRERCLKTTQSLLNDLLPSPMFDPLDGGVSAARRGSSWAFPSYVRDCPTQARVAVTLLEAYRATQDPRALHRALALIDFAETHFLNPDGLFSIGLTREPDLAKWLWTIEEIQKILPPEDAAWWIKATGMKDLGNLPSEVDPKRDFFRQNTLGLVQPIEEIAAGLSLSVEAFKPRLESVKQRLLKAREDRLGTEVKDPNSHIAATLRMVSAYSMAFTITGDAAYREKAVKLLTKAREAFGVGPRLRLYPAETPESIGAGRAFHYSLALQAVLDVAAVSSDDQWLRWSEDLASTSAELFTGNGFLKECPDDAKFFDLPITDLLMLFDDSSAGLVSMAEGRLAELGRPLVRSYSELATPLPLYTKQRPVLHTDLLMANLGRHHKVLAIYASDVSPEMKTAVQRLHPRLVHRRAAKPDEQVPSGAVKILLPDGASQVITDPTALAKSVRAAD